MKDEINVTVKNVLLFLKLQSWEIRVENLEVDVILQKLKYDYDI